MSPLRAAGVVFIALGAAACSLLVDTDGLSSGTGSDGGSDAAPDAAPTDAANEASSDAGGDAGGDAGDPYVAAVLEDGPVAYWRMDAKPNDIVADQSGHANDLTLRNGGQAIVAGAVGSAIHFDGTKSFATAKDSRALDFANGVPFTLEVWARRTGSGGYYAGVIVNMDPTGARNGYLVFELANPGGTDTAHTSFEWDVAGDLDSAYGALPPALQWTHLVAVYASGTVSLYENAALAQTKARPGTFGPLTSTFTVGAWNAEGNSPFDGDLDEIAVYPTALTPSRITAHYQAAPGR